MSAGTDRTMNPVVTVGDVILDGRAERLSTDAPVPVIDHAEEHTRPGAGPAALPAAEDGPYVVPVTPLGPGGDPAPGRVGQRRRLHRRPAARNVRGGRLGGRTVVVPYLPGRSTTRILAHRT